MGITEYPMPLNEPTKTSIIPHRAYVVQMMVSLCIPASITSGLLEYIPSSSLPNRTALLPIINPVIVTHMSPEKRILLIRFIFPAPRFWLVNDNVD